MGNSIFKGKKAENHYAEPTCGLGKQSEMAGSGERIMGMNAHCSPRHPQMGTTGGTLYKMDLFLAMVNLKI